MTERTSLQKLIDDNCADGEKVPEITDDVWAIIESSGLLERLSHAAGLTVRGPGKTVKVTKNFSREQITAAFNEELDPFVELVNNAAIACIQVPSLRAKKKPIKKTKRKPRTTKQEPSSSDTLKSQLGQILVKAQRIPTDPLARLRWLVARISPANCIRISTYGYISKEGFDAQIEEFLQNELLPLIEQMNKGKKITLEQLKETYLGNRAHQKVFKAINKLFEELSPEES
jgi:hypothetical protein